MVLVTPRSAKLPRADHSPGRLLLLLLLLPNQLKATMPSPQNAQQQLLRSTGSFEEAFFVYDLCMKCAHAVDFRIERRSTRSAHGRRTQKESA